MSNVRVVSVTLCKEKALFLLKFAGLTKVHLKSLVRLLLTLQVMFVCQAQSSSELI